MNTTSPSRARRKVQRTPTEEATLATLRAELPVAARDDAFPFVGRLPQSWTATLEPYRDRLVATIPRHPVEIGLDVMHFDPKGRRGFHVSRE